MNAPTAQRRSAGCPSNLELDELAAGDLAADPAREQRLREHLAGCAVCRERAAQRAADPVLVPDAGTIRALLAARATDDVATGRARANHRRRIAAGLGVAAAAGVAALVILGPRPATPPPPGQRTKGGLALTVHIKRSSNGAIDAINGEGQLRAGDEMRFTLAAAAPGYAVVLGLDATPGVSIYAPRPAGAPAPLIQPGQPVTLDGSLIADDTPGFERIAAIVCASAPAVDELQRRAQAALTAAAGRPEAVAALGSGCLESSVLLRKTGP